jgi:hypothetical protein
MGAEFAGFGFESGESNELMSMVADSEEGEHATRPSQGIERVINTQRIMSDQRSRIVLAVAEIQIRQ